MAETVYLTPEEELQNLSDLLIQSIIQDNEVCKTNRQYLFGQLPPKVFTNEHFVIYYVLTNFRDKGITPDREFLKMYLMRNTKLFRDKNDNIDVSVVADVDEDTNIAYVSTVLGTYERLLKNTPLEFDEFKLTVEKYKSQYSAFEMNKAYSQSKLILYDGVQIGRKFYQGYDDSVAYIKNKTANIEAILSHTTGEGFINSREMGLLDEDTVKPDLIGNFGLIRELNEQLGGVYTSIFYNVMAPTKGGKSKFCARIMHNIMVEHGHNISVWAHEGGYQAWWAQLRAIHYEYLYLRNNPDTKYPAISQKDILYGKYPSDTVKALEEASRLDLFTNPDYGICYMIDRPFNVETFIDEIETSVQLNDSKAVCIDYLQLIGWDSKSKSKPQAIGQAYQALLAYCKKRNVMAISPSQFTQEFMNEMARAKDGDNHELRTAGGESSEIIRTPDINIALYASTEDLMRHEMTIMSVPSRLSEPFPNIKIYADLCSCVFSSMTK